MERSWGGGLDDPLRVSHGKFVLPRKASISQNLLANSGHPTAIAV